MARVLITGARAPISYAIVQQHVALGHEVVLTDSTKHVSIKNSKFIETFILTTSPRFNTSQYIEEINRIIHTFHIDYIVPLNEESFYLSFHKGDIHAPVWVEDIRKMLAVHNKYNFSQLMTDLGFKAPPTFYVFNERQLESFVNNYPGNDYYVKAPFGRFGQSVKKVNRHDLIDVAFPYIIQTNITGTEWCTYSVASSGDALSTALYLSNTHESYHCSTHFESTDYPRLKTLIEEIIKKLDWSYQIAFDVIECDKTGDFYLIECNPRATNGALFMQPKVWELKYCEPVIETRQLIFVSLYNWIMNPKKKTFKKLKKGRDVFWHPNEKAIFLNQLVSGMQWWWLAKQHKKTINTVTTYDIEWND